MTQDSDQKMIDKYSSASALAVSLDSFVGPDSLVSLDSFVGLDSLVSLDTLVGLDSLAGLEKVAGHASFSQSFLCSEKAFGLFLFTHQDPFMYTVWFYRTRKRFPQKCRNDKEPTQYSWNSGAKESSKISIFSPICTTSNAAS